MRPRLGNGFDAHERLWRTRADAPRRRIELQKRHHFQPRRVFSDAARRPPKLRPLHEGIPFRPRGHPSRKHQHSRRNS